MSQNNFAATGIVSENNNSENSTQKITLKKGTKITLQLNNDISSRDMEEGNVVEMMVMMDVMVNGKKVIASGTFAEGIVTTVRRSGNFGRSGYIELEGVNVRSIDGQRITIKSVKVRKRGRNRKGLAVGASILIPTVGILMGAPILIPFVAVGLVVRGRDVEILSGTLVSAKIMEDVKVHLN